MDKTYPFSGKILIIGFGSIGQAMLPLLFRHFKMNADRIAIVTADERGKDIAAEYGVRFLVDPLRHDNYREIVMAHADRGDFLLNLSVDVSSVALAELCQRNGIFYLDTCIEPWPGRYTNPDLSISERSNYALREEAKSLKDIKDLEGPRTSAVFAHGANPGIISHILKKAIVNLANDLGRPAEPKTKEEWGKLAEDLGIKVIHIAERDTQTSAEPKKIGEFINTWSIDGFFSEGSQPSEMGWCTHEKKMPEDGKRHDFGCDSAIYLNQPGFKTRVRSWTPTARAQHGWIITHNESVSIADYFTVREGGKVTYRPTVHYAYHPCDGAVLSLHELAGKNGELQEKQRLITTEILPGGVDELGVLLMGHEKGAYWYGSRLSIDEARRLVPHNSATSLQVVAGILGAMVWMLENPEKGIMDADELDYHTVLEAAWPYLGEMIGEYTSWTPLEGRGGLFPEKVDEEDPWQFSNFRVS